MIGLLPDGPETDLKEHLELLKGKVARMERKANRTIQEMKQ